MRENSRFHPAQDLPALTSLRFAAALMVFLLHLREFAPDLSDLIEPAAMNQGVSFFFVLSGFILSHAYARRPLDPAAFLRARFARLYPTHLATLVLILLVLPYPAARFQNLSAPETLVAWLAKVTMTEAWLPMGGVARAFNGVSWSISAEMSFYLAFPVLLPFVRRRPTATLAAAGLASLSVYGLGMALGLPDHGGDRFTPTLYPLGTFNPLARGFEFVLGMATYAAVAPRIAATSLSSLSYRLWSVLEAAAFAALALWLALAVPAINRWAEGAFYVWFHCAGSAWAFALLIGVMAPGRGALGRALSVRPLVWLGEVSFAFYMVHEVALRVLRLRFGEHPPILAAFALALVLAAVMRHFVETPARAWLLGGAKKKAAAAV